VRSNAATGTGDECLPIVRRRLASSQSNAGSSDCVSATPVSPPGHRRRRSILRSETLLRTEVKERSKSMHESLAYTTIRTRRELAHRSGNGLDVTLLWVRGDDGDTVVVCVSDSREGAYFEIPTEPYLALDVYYHPSCTETSAPSTTRTAA
jgi:hypothetical protein